MQSTFQSVDSEIHEKLGAGLDAVSIEEAELGLRAGFQAGEILFTPNGVSFEEIKKGVELGLIINIDNISILEQFGNEYGNTVPCCIRMNPHIAAGGINIFKQAMLILSLEFLCISFAISSVL